MESMLIQRPLVRDLAIGAAVVAIGVALVFVSGGAALTVALVLALTVWLIARKTFIAPLGRKFNFYAGLSLILRPVVGMFLVAVSGPNTDFQSYFANAKAYVFGNGSSLIYQTHSVPGTGAVDRVSIGLYRCGLTTMASQTVVYAVVGWLGIALSAAAIVHWVNPEMFRRLDRSDRNSRRAIIALLFLPSSLLWVSVVGKDALMALAIGLTLFGVTRLATGRRGRGALAAGTIIGLLVRPHVVLLLLVVVGIAFLLPSKAAISPSRGARARPRRTTGSLFLPLALVVLVAPIAFSFLQTGLHADTASEALAAVGHRTDYGGSSFAPPSLLSPTAPLLVPLTVFFRPFPQEAGTILAFFESLESAAALVLLGWILATRAGRLRRRVRDPLARSAALYLIGFAIVFNSISNFGLLSRQRVQALEMAVALVAVLLAGSDAPVPAPSGGDRAA
ncbi:MAG: hypothetical protein U0V73_07735 [Acidimicrobiia bacterium]